MNIAQSRPRAATPAAETLEVELDRIAALGLNELRALWLKMTGQGAPRVLSGALLARMIAHRIQERRLGKLTREMRQRLDGLPRGGGEPIRHLKVGTVMVRGAAMPSWRSPAAKVVVFEWPWARRRANGLRSTR
jgi:Protein of unknown function (DUF2924)